MNGRRPPSFVVAAVVLAVAVVCLAAEAALRVLEVVPPPERLDIVIEPGGKYQAPDAELGYLPLPGRYRIVFDHKDVWTQTNLPDTTRVTRLVVRDAARRPRPSAWMFGCSFTQGWGLDDDGTLPWKVQQRRPDVDVVNFGVGGYGTLQMLLQFRRALKERPAPATAVLVYASFHDERNVRTDTWRDANFNYERFGTTAQPYARLDWSGRLRYASGAAEVPLMSARRHSVAFNVAMIGLGNLRARFLEQHRVSELLIEEFVEESRRHGVTLVLAGIWADDLTRQTLARFAAMGVRTVDISTDQRDRRNLIPYDGHPSAFANEQSATTLAAALP